MSALAARRIFGQFSRLSTRNQAGAGTRFVARRGMASDAHLGAKSSSDLPWIIGSGTALVVGSAYILSPPAKKHAHSAAKASATPIEKALPPSEKDESEPESALKSEPQIVKDDEGTEADVSQSLVQSFDADAPKDAKAAEEETAAGSTKIEPDTPTPINDDTPAVTEEAHAEETPEQKEKPTQRSGTLQGEGETGPTDLSAARETAKSGASPKEASGQEFFRA